VIRVSLGIFVGLFVTGSCVSAQVVKVPAPAQTAVPQPLSVIRECPICPEMVLIPAGSFAMGVPKAEDERELNCDCGGGLASALKPKAHCGCDVTKAETLVHPVQISRPFYLGKYDVTRGQYAAFLLATARTARVPPSPAQTDRHPVVFVTWDDATAYVQWLSKQTGKPYRLPTEAEWEYAARAGTTTARYWGDSNEQQCRYANGRDLSKPADDIHPKDVFDTAPCRSGFAGISPVGSFQPNGFGLFDMLGNVQQWVEDCYSLAYSSAPTDGSAYLHNEWVGESSCGRVSRGGSWSTPSRQLRAGVRSYGSQDYSGDWVGFRVARTLPP
jgi:formylglycine-generating enzyme required for sulfatase activity